MHNGFARSFHCLPTFAWVKKCIAMSEKLSSVRKDYQKNALDESTAGQDPTALLKQWLSEAEANDPEHFNAMTLATTGIDGFPHARIVLLRSFDSEGLSFFTNYQSNKGRELLHNDKACINFFWPDLERQVRVYGNVYMLSGAESDTYYSSRPRESQIGAWASAQSRVISTREDLEQRVANLMKQYEGQDIPRPPHWGGFRLEPVQFEFWQGRSNRLHDRIVFRSPSSAGWVRERLSP